MFTVKAPKTPRQLMEEQWLEIRQGAASLLALCNPSLMENADEKFLRQLVHSMGCAKRRVARGITAFEDAIDGRCSSLDLESDD